MTALVRIPKRGASPSISETVLRPPEVVARHRELQGRLWNANLAGVVYPKRYGGLGLTRGGGGGNWKPQWTPQWTPKWQPKGQR